MTQMTHTLFKFIGPRTPDDVPADEKLQYQIPTVFLTLAALLLIASIFLPYWRMTLLAPQYPGGLEVMAYVNRVAGDVQEIDGLNHYIGMRSLQDGATFERSISIIAISTISLLVLAAVFVHTKWAALLALPALTFPIVFLADLYFWLRYFGTNLDPTAPLSGAIKPFVPPVLGPGKVAQFETVAVPGSGLYLAALASLLVLVGLYFHRRAYKPLVDADQS